MRPFEFSRAYEHHPDLIADYPNIRRVAWEDRVSRDDLSAASKNTLGSTLTVFEPGEPVLQDLEQARRGERTAPTELEEEAEEQEFEIILRDTLSRSHEFIKDRILSLSSEAMEELTAALLRAMGYKTRVTPKGPDQGRDVIASPDGLGFQNPRIIAEVKHRRREAMGAQQIRGFVGGPWLVRQHGRLHAGGSLRSREGERSRDPGGLRLPGFACG